MSDVAADDGAVAALGRAFPRRSFLKGGMAAGLVALAPTVLVTSGCEANPNPDSLLYGHLSDTPDANGLRLPPGFTSRKLAVSGEVVESTGGTIVWPLKPDGGACFDAGDGGWIYVVNSERPDNLGGVSAIRFAPDGTVIDVRTILSGTSVNCLGGPTPWGTWLSCEETIRGVVWECDPFGEHEAIGRDAMGWFTHEAAAVDPVGRAVYMTEDRQRGALYRFTPDTWGDLSSGRLDVLVENGDGLSWGEVTNPCPGPWGPATSNQVPDTKRFDGGEGAWFQNGALYFTTKGDNRVWRLDPTDPETPVLTIHYDRATSLFPELNGVDNITGKPGNNDLYVAEDNGDMQIVVVVDVDGVGIAGPVVELPNVGFSEMTGVAFNPAGDRLYFSEQHSPGTTFEVTGPFRD